MSEHYEKRKDHIKTAEKNIKNLGIKNITIKNKDIYEGINDIEKVNDFGQLQEIKIKAGSDPHHIITQILSKTKVSKFEITSPSLNDIFIRN